MKRRHFDASLLIQSRSVSKLNLHDRVLHLILTWKLRPIKKHVKLLNIDYWWLNYFKSNRCPDLTLILFNYITKAIGRGMNTNITLPHGTYLSYIFRQLGISTHGDTPVSSNQPICYGALHHARYLFDAASNIWMKHDQRRDSDDDDIDTAFDDISEPEPISPLPSSSHADQPSSEVNSAILNTVHSLSTTPKVLEKMLTLVS
ncbi:hypothetical protein PVK06_024557 [Gossypium arboreum]|uniref:Uncharacterized protein n=1 Tax=Gossypium arboreum TaxID=29729 RepID=A0ABR0PE87_GOSAR|nr:hypothetical protein PVK06_024557 [Gossypium arboreum]